MMDYSNSTQLDIFDIYRRFSDFLESGEMWVEREGVVDGSFTFILTCFADIKSGNIYSFREGADMLNDDAEKIKFSREAMAQLSKMVDLSVNGSCYLWIVAYGRVTMCAPLSLSRQADIFFWPLRHIILIMILDELHKLMLQLNIMADFSEFSNFYDFVFFMCRENGQKNITVSRAIAAWKLVLAGRFRLLNQWCDFVEKNQRYNISEDTWRQVLAFSRCVHEDLEGYDPEESQDPMTVVVTTSLVIVAIPRMNHLNLLVQCLLSFAAYMPVFSSASPTGLRNLPGLKRKYHGDANRMGSYMYSSCPSNVINSIINFKRRKQHQNKLVKSEEDLPGCALCEQGLQTLKVTSPLNNSKSPCAVEGCLSQGFSGLFSSPPCVENQE
ncbi:hypothetical protein Cgig2_006279 [Carnegiea gigantea]|uniref:Defective in cullin neddylation protein n=1 Tax=Carnegiea gigantea TaxID=171969 RepID=A0A9Q1QA05_9CARY|nr:hypothetical protein Cgig2_006279 [Carnegiea gigantea]